MAPSPARVRALWIVCLMFAGVGLLVTVAGRTALFSAWRGAAATALFERPSLPTALEPFVALTDSIIGGSIVGKWIAAAWLVARPLAAGRVWAWWALVAGLLGWFLLDSGLSLVQGAGFNVWMINLAPLLVFGGLLLTARPKQDPGSEPAPRSLPLAASTHWNALRWVCVGFAVFGVVVALGNETPLFAIYRQAIADAWFGGTFEADAWVWLRFGYGIIGATFFAHFLMLAIALRHAPGERWVLSAVASSMLGWFLVDATASALHDAWFNVWMIDVPSLVALAVPWWLAMRSKAWT